MLTLTDAAPSKRLLGTLNGVAQMGSYVLFFQRFSLLTLTFLSHPPSCFRVLLCPTLLTSSAPSCVPSDPSAPPPSSPSPSPIPPYSAANSSSSSWSSSPSEVRAVRSGCRRAGGLVRYRWRRSRTTGIEVFFFLMFDGLRLDSSMAGSAGRAVVDAGWDLLPPRFSRHLFLWRSPFSAVSVDKEAISALFPARV
jgi:hypothetical protein